MQTRPSQAVSLCSSSLLLCTRVLLMLDAVEPTVPRTVWSLGSAPRGSSIIDRLSLPAADAISKNCATCAASAPDSNASDKPNATMALTEVRVRRKTRRGIVVLCYSKAVDFFGHVVVVYHDQVLPRSKPCLSMSCTMITLLDGVFSGRE